MSIRVNYHFDKIWIVEGVRGLVEDFVFKIPSRRPQPPQKLAKLATILSKTCPSSLRVKIVLIPETVFGFRGLRVDRFWNVLNVVTSPRYECSYTLRPKGSQDTCGSSSPVVSGKNGILKFQHIHESK